MNPPFVSYPSPYRTPYMVSDFSSQHSDGSAFWYRLHEDESISDLRALQLETRIQLPGGGVETSNIKHRRTRSGCFTCRSRRVKCDETRPICDRCRKGERDCEFPVPAPPKRTKQSVSRPEDESTDSVDVLDDAEQLKEIEKAAVSLPKKTRPSISQARQHSSPSLARNSKAEIPAETRPSREQKSPISTTSSSSRSRSRADTPASSLQQQRSNTPDRRTREARIQSLPRHMQKYLQFQQQHMTYHHYFLKWDTDDFVHDQLIDLALEFEPLLHAVVGFAAYHYELQKPDGAIRNFFRYYNSSVSLLRKSLERNEKATEATLLTVLQLECFEESIGDLINFFGHHRAATAIFKSLLTPATMSNSTTRRRIFGWFARNDLIVSLASGVEANLGREWFVASADWYASQIDTDAENDVDLEHTMAYFVAMNRLIGFDLSRLFATMPRGEMSMEEFVERNNDIARRVQEMRLQIQRYNDDFYTVHEFPVEKSRPLTEDDIVNPYLPGGLFKDALWPMNYMWLDWYAIDLWQRFQSCNILRQPPPPELSLLSLEMSRLFEAMTRWPDAPTAALLGCHGTLAIFVLFLPRDGRHINWVRRKLADIEKLGYVFPPKFRKRMAQLWKLTDEDVGTEESVEHWWLPKGQEQPQLIADLKQLVAERHSADEETLTATMADLRSSSSDMRDIKAVFGRMEINIDGETPTPSSGGSVSPSPHSDTSGTSTASGLSPVTSNTGNVRGMGVPVVSSGHQSRRGTGSGSSAKPSAKQGKNRRV